MRFKLLLASGMFTLGLILLPFSYAPETENSSVSENSHLNIAHAQSEVGSRWSLNNILSSVMRQVNGVLDFTAQAIQAVGDAPSQLFDIASNNPPQSAGEAQDFNTQINSEELLFAPTPQLYDGTLVINVPLQASNDLSVNGLTRLNDLFVSGEFSITDLDVPAPPASVRKPVKPLS